MVMLRAQSARRQPTPATSGAGFLKPTRSTRSRAFAHAAAAPGTTLPGVFLPGTSTPCPIDLFVTVYKGSSSTRYPVSLRGATPEDGLYTVWFKLDAADRYTGTHYNLTFTGSAGTCDCPACCYESAARADRRHGHSSDSHGCAKLDTFAALVAAGLVPNPRPTVANRVCRHCRCRPVARPRGLCWGCYYAPGVRDQYPVSDAPQARRGVGNLTGVRPLPDRPTAAPPGTADKMSVLADRAARGLALWHPADACDHHTDPTATLTFTLGSRS